ncbi:hypothetical protein BBJ28_00009097 [Nothophytophthora sp. Chile5]|nr:hypothetical protein BBJ28_00009097 [Nothophytophthora sp. Chile5]
MSSTAAVPLLHASSSPPPSKASDYAAVAAQESPLSVVIDVGPQVAASEASVAAGGAYVAASESPSSCGASASARKRNPFVYTSRVDTYERCKMALLCLMGVPVLRVVLLLCVGVMLVIVSNVALFGYKPLDIRTGGRAPLPRWRRMLGFAVPYLLRMVLFLVGYYWVPVKYPRHFDRRTMPRVIVSNHVSFLDGLFLFSLLSPSIAMKADVVKLPLISRIVQLIQPILIDRGSSGGRKRAVHDIAAHVANPRQPPLLLFPEGTTSNQQCLTKFKVGSFTMGVPCQPVVLRYPFRHFDVSWPPSVSGLYLALRLLCQVYNRLEVEILPAYYPSEREQQDPELYAEGVRREMAKALGVPTTNHAFEDVAMLLRLGDYATQNVVPVTDVSEVLSLTALKRGDVDRLVEHFRRRDLDQDGQLSMEELQALFPQDDPSLVEQLFDLVDANDSGLIDFRELCLALRALNPHDISKDGQSDDALSQFAFRLYDLDDNGVIDAAELEQLLHFHQNFYGVPESSVTSALREATQAHVPNGAGITFEAFEHIVERNPELLGYARAKLEILRGSLRESDNHGLQQP